MLNFFFSNIKPTFVQEKTINEGFDYKNEAFVFINASFIFINEGFVLIIESFIYKNESSVYSLYLIPKYLSIREKEVLP